MTITRFPGGAKQQLPTAMKTAAEQFQMLTDIWPRWRAIAASGAPASGDWPAMKRRATMAVKALYGFYGRAAPTIAWQDTPRVLHLKDRDVPPFVCHFRESLIYSVWHKIADPAWVCSQVGYDRRQHIFRLPLNKRAVIGRSRISPSGRDRRRLPWITDTNNVISQFDVDSLAIVELASKLGRIDPQVSKLATIIERLASSCFAAITFDDLCILLAKPDQITIDENQQLSARGTPAIAWQSEEIEKRHSLFAINGDVFIANDLPDLNNISYATPRERALLIEYFGWETFFDRVKNRQIGAHMQKIDKHDRYGSLFLITFLNQQFLVVRVKNRTAEPDGSFRRYVIPVDRECRPLPHPNKPQEHLGAPQKLTARNAVASTFGMTGEEYEKILGAES